MTNTAGMGQLLTILALVVAPVGIFLTYNGVDDLRVISATTLSVAWLSVAMLAYHRRSALQRLREQQDLPTADQPEA